MATPKDHRQRRAKIGAQPLSDTVQAMSMRGLLATKFVRRAADDRNLFQNCTGSRGCGTDRDLILPVSIEVVRARCTILILQFLFELDALCKGLLTNRRVAELQEDQEEEPDDDKPEPSAKLKVVSKD